LWSPGLEAPSIDQRTVLCVRRQQGDHKGRPYIITAQK
jgi:hypothetical protein